MDEKKGTISKEKGETKINGQETAYVVYEKLWNGT